MSYNKEDKNLHLYKYSALQNDILVPLPSYPSQTHSAAGFSRCGKISGWGLSGGCPVEGETASGPLKSQEKRL